MQDLYGDGWKEMLDSKGRQFVKWQESRREKVQRESGFTPVRLARDDEYPAVWHEHVEMLKTRLLQKKQAHKAKGKKA